MGPRSVFCTIASSHGLKLFFLHSSEFGRFERNSRCYNSAYLANNRFVTAMALISSQKCYTFATRPHAICPCYLLSMSFMLSIRYPDISSSFSSIFSHTNGTICNMSETLQLRPIHSGLRTFTNPLAARTIQWLAR